MGVVDSLFELQQLAPLLAIVLAHADESPIAKVENIVLHGSIHETHLSAPIADLLNQILPTYK